MEFDFEGKLLNEIFLEKEFDYRVFPSEQTYSDLQEGTSVYYKRYREGTSSNQAGSYNTYKPLNYAYAQLNIDDQGNYFISGILGNGEKIAKLRANKMFVLKFDKTGKPLWDKTYPLSFQLQAEMKHAFSHQGLFKSIFYKDVLYVQVNRYPSVETFKIDMNSGKKVKNWTHNMGKRNVVFNGTGVGWKEQKTPEFQMKLAMAKYACPNAYRKFNSLKSKKDLNFNIIYSSEKTYFTSYLAGEKLKLFVFD